MGGNTFSNNGLRGLSCFSSSICLVENDTFTNNGGGTTGGDPIQGYGGIAVGQSAVLDAGGGSNTLDWEVRSSAGSNTFSLNNSSTDSELDIHNLTATEMKAECNTWGGATTADWVTGSVDYTPIEADCGTVQSLRGCVITGGGVR
jgi:hypothetical protein